MKPSNNRSWVGENWAMEYQRSVRVLTNGGFCGKCGCETINLSVIKIKKIHHFLRVFMRVRWKMKQHEIGFYQKNVGLSLRPLWLFPRISNFWPPKGAIKRKKAKPIPTIHHHRGAINCVWVFNFSSFWVRFKRFLWLSILTEWYPLFLFGDRLLFWVHKNVEKWPTIHISIEATFAFLRANFLGYSYQGYADDNWYQKRIMNAHARAKLFLLMLYSYFYIHVCFDFLMRLFVSSNFLHLFALLFLICWCLFSHEYLSLKSSYDLVNLFLKQPNLLQNTKWSSTCIFHATKK